MRAHYSSRGDRELAVITWSAIGGANGLRLVFEKFLAALDPAVFGIVKGTIRVAVGTSKRPEIETWTLDELERRWTPGHFPFEAKLDLQPTVVAHDGEIELVELAQEEWQMDMVPIVARGERWGIVGHPPGAENESLLFADVGFDSYGDHDVLTVWFHTKTDLWLAVGLDGEPTGPDQRANRALLISALQDIAARTGGNLELYELALSLDARP